MNEVFGFGGGTGSNWIDKVQNVVDYGSAAIGFVPGLNFVASGIDTISAGIDAAQGQYGDAAFRGAMAAAGVVPGVGSVGKLAGKGLGRVATGIGARQMGKAITAMKAARSNPAARTAARTMFEKGKKIQKIGAEYTAGLQANQFRLPQKLGGRGVVSGKQAYGRGYGRNMFQGENPLRANRSNKFDVMSKGLGSAKNYSRLVNLGLAGLAGYQAVQGIRDYMKDDPETVSAKERVSAHYTTYKPSRKPSNQSGASSAFGINQADEGQTQSASERFRNKF